MIRAAVEKDVPRVVELISRSLVDGPYAGTLADNPKQTAILARKVMNGLGKILLWEENGHIGGLLSFIVLPHYTSGELIADEIAWYVEPEVRTGGAALRLLWKAESEARDMGATRIKFSSPSPEVSAIYERFGYRQMETVHVKELCHSSRPH